MFLSINNPVRSFGLKCWLHFYDYTNDMDSNVNQLNLFTDYADGIILILSITQLIQPLELLYNKWNKKRMISQDLERGWVWKPTQASRLIESFPPKLHLS